MIDVTIVIVNWNTRDFLKKCLFSIYKYTKKKFQIIVIDNASKDGSFNMVERDFQDEIELGSLIVLKNSKNLGFAKAVNIGIKKANCSYILLLNPDTVIIDNAIDKMIEFMSKDQSIGILGPKLLYNDRTLQPSCRQFPTLFSQILVLLKLHNLFPQFGPIKRYYMLDFKYDIPAQVDQVMGACFLVKRELIEKIGLFDEKYWIWFEEVDYCKRAKQADYQIVYIPYAHVLHHKGKSFGNVSSPLKQIRMNNSLLHYFMKHHTIIHAFVILLFYPISLLLTIPVMLFGLHKPNKDL